MSNEKQTYEDLEQQVNEAHQLIAALRGGEIDAVVTKLDVSLLRARELEAALLQSEANFRSSLDNSPVGIRIVSAAGDVLCANQAILDIYGFDSVEELNATPAEERYTPESYIEYQERKVKRQRGEYVPSNYEIDIVRKDGEIRRLEVLHKEVLWNGEPQFQVVSNDITVRIQAEVALKHAAAEWLTTFDSIPDMISLFDKEHKILRVNKRFADVLKTTPQELIGKHCYRTIHGTEQPRPLCPHINALETLKAETIEYYEPILGIHIEETASPIFSATGEISGAVHIMKDISARKQAEAENQQLRDKAEISSRLAAIGEMAAGIAHEINNPLTAVIGFSDLLIERNDLPDDVKGELKMINNGSVRVKDIVKHMLTFARETLPVKTAGSMNELVDATLDLRAYVLRTANINVIKDFDVNLPNVNVDLGQIEQVFLNIIINAEYEMKTAHGRGTLTITTAKVDDQIQISFKDDGRGMSHSILGKLFNPFFTTKAVGEGTGLGLSLSRSIVLAHGGNIEVESEVDKGSTFIVTLPIIQTVKGQALQPTAKSNTSPENFKRALILVVDDEADIRSLVSTILETSGHIVETTGDAAKALSKIEKVNYDAILMDVRIPGMSGMELYGQINKMRPEIASKIIFMSGDISDPNTRLFLANNNLSYIAKPFDKDTLIQKVNSIL